MLRVRTLLVPTLLSLSLLTSLTSVAEAQAPNEAALAAFGGFVGLSKMTQDFVERVQKNPSIGRFFKEADNERLQAMLTDQFCDVLGGGCKYSGKSMVEAHTNMKVASADFNALAEELQNALNAANVPFAAQNKLIAKLAPMHRDVVQQ